VINRSILIVSPEFWSDHCVSKHHYAVTLAINFFVFFLNPPIENVKHIDIKKSSVERLYLISFGGIARGLRFFPSFVRQYFERNFLYDIEKKTGKRIDIVWLFENSRFFDMRFAEDRIKIYHQVDLNQNFNLQVAASTADICFCTTNFIKNKILKFNKNTYKIDHGVTPFEERSLMPFEYSGKFKSNRINVVYVGNLQMEYLDNELLMQLVCKFKNVHFHFVGWYTKDCLLWKMTDGLSNITWWGKVDYHFIPNMLEKFDVLLVVYKEKHYKDQANPHKIMEYLLSGKVIVATYTDEYKDKRHLLEMVDNSSDYINVFERVVNNLSEYNSEERQFERNLFAESNTYDKQIDKIFSLLRKHNLLSVNQ
jgi:hypothetical protein